MTFREWIDSGPQHRKDRPPPRAAVISIAGSSALAAGIYLWWRASAPSAPIIGITSSGIVAGWAAAF